MKNNGHSSIPPGLMRELQRAADKAARGVRNRRDMQQACAEMDRVREELRDKLGELDVSVDFIREVRDDA